MYSRGAEPQTAASCAVGPARSLVGRAIGSYTITGGLGEGGMGRVYQARHTLIGRKAAVKVLNPDISADEEVVSRFFNEARAVNDIRHPNIVEVTDFGQFGDLYCIVMELLEGETLAERLDRARVLDEAAAIHIARQVTSALGATHERGLVHRDLKPENIFLCSHPDYPDFVKVLDFGIAKLLGTDSNLGHHTRTGAVLGTPTYMSPEQCLGEPTLDGRSDIYSLGVVLYQMVTGQPPFIGETLGRLIVCHVNERPVPPVVLNPQLSPRMNAVILRALEKKPKDRYGSMKELREALEGAPSRSPGSPRSAQLRPAVPGSPPATTMATRAPTPAPRGDRGAARGEARPDKTPGPAAPGENGAGPTRVAPSPAAANAAAPTRVAAPPAVISERAATTVDFAPPDLPTSLAAQIQDRLATGRIELPALPPASQRCMELLRQSHLGFGEAAALIAHAPRLRSRVMRLANSPAFPSLMPATTLELAIARLGTEGLYTALVEFTAREVLDGRHPRVKEVFRRMWPHALGVAFIAQELAESLNRASEASFAYLAGIMHNVGKPVVASVLLDMEEEKTRAGTRPSLTDADWMRAIDAAHRPVGAAIARGWRLAHPVVEAIEGSGAYDEAAGASLGNILRFSAALAHRLGLTIGQTLPGAADAACTEGTRVLRLDDRLVRRVSHGLKERAIALSGIRGQ